MHTRIKSTATLGVPVVALINVTEKEAAVLRKKIADKRWAFTCASMVCTHAHDFDTGLLPGGSYMTPSSLLTALVDLSVARPNRARIITMESFDLPQYIEKQSGTESNLSRFGWRNSKPYVAIGAPSRPRWWPESSDPTA